MYSIILVALDGSQTASHALDAALELAADAHARLVPVYVVDMPVFAFDTPGYDPSILVDAFREEGRRVLDDAQARMTRRGVAGAPRSSRSSRRARMSPSASSARRARSARA